MKRKSNEVIRDNINTAVDFVCINYRFQNLMKNFLIKNTGIECYTRKLQFLLKT